MQAIELPETLFSQALSTFDSLVSKGKVFYEETQGEIVHDNGFTFEFRISSALLHKPILPADAPERHGTGGPFIDPDPDMVIARPGPDHLLIVSMHCVQRPAFILATRLFAPQTDRLDRADLAAALAVMETLRRGSGAPQMMIYNCGVEAGCSQGHKHMQIFAVPGVGLFPDRVALGDDIVSDIPGVPYKHFVLRLPRDGGLEEIYARLTHVIEAAAAANGACGGGEAMNVVLTDAWVCAIPRRHVRRGRAAANAMSMMGAVWVKDEEQRKSWEENGYGKHLAYLGVPRDDLEGS